MSSVVTGDVTASRVPGGRSVSVAPSGLGPCGWPACRCVSVYRGGVRSVVLRRGPAGMERAARCRRRRVRGEAGLTSLCLTCKRECVCQ